MSTFFAGNDKLLLIKKQVDKDTPVSDFSDAMAIRVTNWTKNPVRTQAPLAETDKAAQQSASHVTAITPSFSFDMYGRPSELDLLAEALLGDNVDSSSHAPTTHTASPVQDPPYYSVMEVNPYGSNTYDGCRCTVATFATSDSGETELKVTGITWEALGYTAHVTPPSPVPDPVVEAPLIHAELAVSYDSVHPGTTSEATITITRNATRQQGDSGFRGLAVTPGKLQVDGQITRYIADDDLLRAVDTGSKAGTTPTAAIYQEPLDLLWDRDSGHQFLITSKGVAYESAAVAVDPAQGTPYKEVLGFRTQPEALLADNVSIVTVNAKNTPAG